MGYCPCVSVAFCLRTPIDLTLIAPGPKFFQFQVVSITKVGSRTRKKVAYNMNRSCDSRKYTYFFPTYLLIPPRPGSGLFYSLRRQNGEPPTHCFWDFLKQADGEAGGGASDPVKPVVQLEELQRKRAWRVGAAGLNDLRAAVKHFEGTHNFHNFTVDKDFRDRSNQRHMKTIQVADPVVHGETEWISVLLHGQSFMLHQVFYLQHWIPGS